MSDDQKNKNMGGANEAKALSSSKAVANSKLRMSDLQKAASVAHENNDAASKVAREVLHNATVLDAVAAAGAINHMCKDNEKLIRECKASLTAMEPIRAQALDCKKSLDAVSKAANLAFFDTKAIAKINIDFFKDNEKLIKASLAAMEPIRAQALDCAQILEPISKKMADIGALQVDFLKSSVVQNVLAASAMQRADISELMNTMHRVQLPNYNLRLSKRLMLPHVAYAGFASATESMINESESIAEQSKLAFSISTAEMALADSTATVCHMLEQPVQASGLIRPVRCNLPYVLRDELLNLPCVSGDCSQLVDKLPTVTNSNLVREVTRLWTACNDVAIARLEKEVFHVTNKIVMVVSSLPHLVSVDEASFCEFTRMLWFMIIEAGDAKFQKGLEKEFDCSIIRHIRILRNLYSCHDIDHSTDSPVVESHKALLSTFECLGINGVPLYGSDYRQMQSKLMEELRDWLRALLSHLLAKH